MAELEERVCGTAFTVRECVATVVPTSQFFPSKLVQVRVTRVPTVIPFWLVESEVISIVMPAAGLVSTRKRPEGAGVGVGMPDGSGEIVTLPFVGLTVTVVVWSSKIVMNESVGKTTGWLLIVWLVGFE